MIAVSLALKAVKINLHAAMSQVLMEKGAAGTAQARYVYGLRLIGREGAAGSYQTYHYDLRGSTTALTDEQGQVTDTYSYDTYGERLSHEGASAQPFQYNGRDGVQTDANGLYQMRSRYYNPEIKRFVNRDVLSGSIGNGLTLNRYAYVNGNPVSYIDPFGLSADGATWWETGLSFAADATPFVGTLKGIQEVFSGVDLITGQQMSVTDRVATGVGTAASLIPFGKFIGKYVAEEGIDGGVWLIGKLKKTPVQTVEPKDYRLKLDLQLFADKNKDIDWEAQIPVFGDDWESYFKSYYGKENVSRNKKGGTGKSINVKLTEPSLPKGSKPKGNYEKGSSHGIKKQNETADTLANNGYNVQMLDEIDGGNGYGIIDGTNPDFLIEGNVFDCYAPTQGGAVQSIIKEIAGKTKEQSGRIVLNLDDFPKEKVDEIVNTISRKANPNGDLKRLQELILVKNGEIKRVFGG